MSAGVVALLTDFGLSDSYVGELHATLWRRAPSLRGVVDLCHAIPPQAVRVGSFAWQRAWRSCGEGTVLVGVVDPGVGGERLVLAASVDGRWLVAPDNGLAAPILAAATAPTVVAADLARVVGEPASATFHGRDVFAPVAALLVEGAALGELGEPIGDWRTMEPPRVAFPSARAAEAEILWIDRFGNVITALAAEAGARWSVDLSPLRARSVERYSQAEPGEAVALVGSAGFWELAVEGGHAAEEFGLDVGASLRFVRE
ncbi:MAG: SAM-dependent chlorinase/fluorinase [Planctomycetota bacterium]